MEPILRAVPEGPGRDAAIELPADGTIAVAIGPIAVAVMVLSAMLVSVAMLVTVLVALTPLWPTSTRSSFEVGCSVRGVG